eukprot:s1414_g6.t2
MSLGSWRGDRLYGVDQFGSSTSLVVGGTHSATHCTGARAAAGTRGKVELLTTPAVAQYHQNPIQIYFCEDNGEFNVGVCEVTNTPWNHHVFFVFRLEGDERPKPLHVSPLMDLKHRWRLKATSPAKGPMEVSVDVLPSLEGKSEVIFKAHLKLELSNFPHARAEHAGSLQMLWDFGFQPQRTALRIYWNALKLLRKGVGFRSHPSPQYKEEVLEATQRSGATKPWWRDNQRFPWNRECLRCGESGIERKKAILFVTGDWDLVAVAAPEKIGGRREENGIKSAEFLRADFAMDCPRLRRPGRPHVVCLTLAAVAVTLGGRWPLAGVVTRDPRAEESASQKVAATAGGTCGEALVAGQQRFESARQQWLGDCTSQRPILLGSLAEQTELNALNAFDQVAGQSCQAERKALQDAIRKDVLYIFQLQRVIAERQALEELNRKLVKKMTQRGGPLRIQEKIDLLQEEVEAYKSSVQRLLPSWASDMGDPAQQSAERHLGELQFTIEESAEGQALQKQWEDQRLQDLMSRRAYGVSVSLDPALRVLIRPEGIGNLQVFSEGELRGSEPLNLPFGKLT